MNYVGHERAIEWLDAHVVVVVEALEIERVLSESIEEQRFGVEHWLRALNDHERLGLLPRRVHYEQIEDDYGQCYEDQE